MTSGNSCNLSSARRRAALGRKCGNISEYYGHFSHLESRLRFSGGGGFRSGWGEICDLEALTGGDRPDKRTSEERFSKTRLCFASVSVGEGRAEESRRKSHSRNRHLHPAAHGTNSQRWTMAESFATVEWTSLCATQMQFHAGDSAIFLF